MSNTVCVNVWKFYLIMDSSSTLYLVPESDSGIPYEFVQVTRMIDRFPTGMGPSDLCGAPGTDLSKDHKVFFYLKKCSVNDIGAEAVRNLQLATGHKESRAIGAERLQIFVLDDTNGVPNDKRKKRVKRTANQVIDIS